MGEDYAWLRELAPVAEKLAQKGDWMLQVDLTDGFHILGIHEKDVPKMAWQCGVTGQTYLYQVLPFGYRLSPLAFCTAICALFSRQRKACPAHVGVGVVASCIFLARRVF